jgi:PGF-CTERM protein
MAFLFSILLVTSAAAPAFAMDSPASSDSQTSDYSRAVSTPGTSYGDQSPQHPAATPDAEVTTVSNETTQWNGTGQNRSVPENATTTDLTLITGQTVTVVETGNETRYRVSGDKKMHKVSTGNATYVFPDGIDFDRFDKHLFNVDFLVEQNLTDAESDSIPVIVSEAEQRGFTAFDSEGVSALDSVAGTQKQAKLESIDAEAGSVSKSDTSAAYRDLAADDSIGQVSLDVKYRVALEQEGDAVSAPSARDNYGVSGNNVKVAVLDTGINESHPAIDQEVVEKDFTGEGTTKDYFGHGTHVAGIIASDNETYTGMAPNASLMDLRVLGFGGYGSTSDIIDAMEYATEQDADIISMSLGGPALSNANDPYKEAINAATSNGTLVVIAAGNNGDYGTIGSPGIHSEALTVGASNASNGEVAWFSSRGPTEHAYNLKPNVVAPGVDVMSANHDGDGFVAKSGTSMATPAVSGIAALVLEENPDLSPQQAKSIITTTADPLANEDEGEYARGTGQVNATDAVGNDIVVSPGTVDFGTYARNTTVTRTISVTNLGDTERTFDLSASADKLSNGQSANVTLDRNSVTVGAGNTAQVQLGVNTSTSRGFYSGSVSFDGGTYTAAFGFVRANNVTIEKEPVGTTSTDGDFVWLFADQYSPFRTTRASGITQIDGSSVTYQVVGDGDYHVFTHGVHENTRTPVVMTDTFTVSGKTTHTLDEANTVAYELNTSAIADQSGSLDTRATEVNYMKSAEIIDEFRFPYSAGFTTDADGTTVRFLPDENLNATVERVLVQSANAGGSDDFSGSDVYHLIHSTHGVNNSRTTAVDPNDLGEKRMTYYRTQRSGSYDVAVSAVGSWWEDYQQLFVEHDVDVTDGIGSQREQSIYVNRNVSDHRVRPTSEEGAAKSWNLSTPGYTFEPAPGESVYRRVNEHPYVGGLDWEIYNGYFVRYSSAPQVERNNFLFQDSTNDTATLRLNGSEVSRTKTTSGVFSKSVGETLDPQTDVELSVDARNGATSLSTRTVTTYEATYAPGEDVTPPSIRTVDVAGLTVNNTAGGTVSVLFTVDSDTDSASAKLATDANGVPFDSGTGNWQGMSVEKIDETWYNDVYMARIDVGETFGQHAGTVDFAVKATDHNGNTVESTTFDAFRVDAKKPTMTLSDVGSGETPTGTSEVVYTNESVTVNFTADGTHADGAPSSVERAGSSFAADFANFRTWQSAERTDDGHWTVTRNLSELPDDGNYTLETFAVDRFENANVSDSGTTVVLDRDAPDLGATVEQAGNEGKVTLRSDEALQTEAGNVGATVLKPAGNDEEVTLTRNEAAGEYVWDGTFALGDDGNYTVTASAADRAGNIGNTESTAEIETVSVDKRNVTVVLEKSGLFIEFRTNETGFDSTVTVTESRSALAPLSRNLAGVNFLNGQLGDKLDANLDNATIGIPVNETNLPKNVEADEVNISYYNPDNGNWKVRDTRIEERNVTGEKQKYWVTDIQHFSTYGAVAEDQQPPIVTAKSPDGKTLPYGTTQQTVRFDYADDISGVDPSAVELSFDGKTVTGAEAANVTSQYATYDATGLTEGTHTATVTVVDEAGNPEQYSTSFTVEADTTPPKVVEADPGDGTTLPAGTESVTLTVSFDDSQSGLDPSTAKVVYDESITFSGSYLVSGNTVSFDATGLSDGSTHTLTVEVADNEGNLQQKTIRFSVAESEESSGGGGGGGGNVPPPSVRVTVTELTDTYAKAEISNARSGSPGDVSFDGGLAGGDVTFRGLTVTPKSSDAEPRFFVEAKSASSAPGGVSAFEGTGETLGYLTVTPTYIGDADLDEVAVQFDVDAAMVGSPENVALYRYDGGSWSEVPTESTGQQGGAYQFEASASASGTYAVGLDESAFEVRDATLDATEVEPGEDVTVSATVENVGSGEGTYEVELVVDGETVATEQVTLASDEETTVEFTRSFEAGEHEVSVGSAGAGTLVVSKSGERGMGDEQDQKTRDDGGNSGGIPGFGVPAALVALLAAALLARRAS